MNILVTIHDEETNMASVVAQLEDERLMVRLFDCDSEQYVMEGTTYPRSMHAEAFRKALSVVVPQKPIITEELRDEWERTRLWLEGVREQMI